MSIVLVFASDLLNLTQLVSSKVSIMHYLNILVYACDDKDLYSGSFNSDHDFLLSTHLAIVLDHLGCYVHSIHV